MKKLLTKLGGAIAVLIIAAGMAGIVAYQTVRDFHHTTVGAWFPDDTQVILVRPIHWPTMRGRTMDLWWVSLKDGNITKTAREQAGPMHDLSFLGAARDRIWFMSTPSDTLVSRGARSATDRYDLKAKLAAHPTLSLRFDLEGFNHDGPVIKDQVSTNYRVFPDGTFAGEHWSTMALKGLHKENDWRRPELHLETSLPGGRSLGPESVHSLPYRNRGFLLDSSGNPIRPREGGWLAVGEELHAGYDTAVKHVIVRMDDKGAVQWKLPLVTTFKDTTVDDFAVDAHFSARLIAMHTTPQRVWVVFELGTLKSGNHETHLVEIDAVRGTVVRSMVPRL